MLAEKDNALPPQLNDYLEIGYWRQRHVRVERVLALAERLRAADEAETPRLERELDAAVTAVRAYDAEAWPFPRDQQRSA